MILESMEYVQFEGEPREWRLLDFSVGPVNLLVGKNATGKSRSLAALRGLAGLVSGAAKPTLKSGSWTMRFQHGGDALIYEIDLHNAKVKRERFTLNGGALLERGDGGCGEIYAQKQDAKVEFQTPETELAVVARRDSIQHPFFEPLHDWGRLLRYYAFGSLLGKGHFAVGGSGGADDTLDTTDTNNVVRIFAKARDCYGADFENAVIQDMTSIGYGIDKIGLAPPRSIALDPSLGGEAVGLFVQESDLAGETDQHIMSVGMFSALSILVQLNYCLLAVEPSCILIDDIGEGLDFDRSSALIKLLVSKAEQGGVQLVMTTNDRFVMNNVPIEKWCVLRREGGAARAYTYANSKDKFDEFKFTGLSNFDFLATDFLSAENLPDA